MEQPQLTKMEARYVHSHISFILATKLKCQQLSVFIFYANFSVFMQPNPMHGYMEGKLTSFNGGDSSKLQE